MSTENLFKPSNRKDCRGVVLANILESVGIPLDRSETYSHRVCNPCGRKIRNLGSLYALIHEETRKPEENPSREAENVPAKSKDVGKRLFCERTPDQHNRSSSVKSQRVKSAEKIISSRKSLSFGKDAESRKTCVQDEMSSKLNIDDLPAAEELQVKVVSLNDGKVKVHLPSHLTIKKLICCLALKEWKTACNLVLKHAELREELKVSFGKAISEEFKNYFKAGTILQATEPEELAAFSNKLLVEEVRVFAHLQGKLLAMNFL